MSVDSYTNKVLKVFDIVDYYVDYLIEKYFKYLKKVVNKFTKIVNKICDIPMYFYTAYRYLTFPTNKIFLIIWRYFKLHVKVFDVLMRKGIHVIKSPPGGGKSLSAFTTAELLYERYGHRAYVNTQFEKPQTDEFGRKFVKHIQFDFEDIFGVRQNNKTGKLEGYQKRRFDSRKGKIVIWDELHMIFNPRENRSGIYMLAWRPFLNNLLMYRHEGFYAHYCLSQLNVDIQLATISNYIHKPTTVLDVNYSKWLKTGKFELIPVKIKYETYKLKDGKEKLYKKWSRRVDYEHLDRYETLAYKNTRSSIPVLKK